ncbi:hypothetical protein [Gallaecimonas sp. GXIMD4217]|uniref:hypothetical protein n=1 Tax=Gallaecimonas sp. GXIMD4217 TaxID=3131927 RepID=UPI00311B1AC4
MPIPNWARIALLTMAALVLASSHFDSRQPVHWLGLFFVFAALAPLVIRPTASARVGR